MMGIILTVQLVEAPSPITSIVPSPLVNLFSSIGTIMALERSRCVRPGQTARDGMLSMNISLFITF